VALIASLLSAAAAIGGTLHAVLKGARISPAAAMQPATPAKYRVSIVERLGLKRLLDEPTRMIVRNIERRPMRAVLSVTGIGFSLAILVVGGFWSDAIDYMINIQMKLAQSEDIAVTFAEPTAARAVYSLNSMPGVQHVETIRSVSARLRFEHRSYRTSITGFPAGATLHLLLDDQLRIAALPSEGLLLTDHLAKLLHVAPGDMLEVEVLEGRRPVRLVPVAGLVKEYVGMAAYMRIEALWRLMDEERVISAAWLATDRTQDRRVFRELKQAPRVAGVTVRLKALKSFYETMARQILIFAFFNTLLAATIAVGVVYNTARIAFSERSRELASLRVLGFRRGEIAYILHGEICLLTLAAIPAGCGLGWGLCALMVQGMQTDLYRVPLVIEPRTYGFAAVVVLAASILSALVIQRKLNRLDLVAVLKVKE
jgi:putative ABC transport system permease protein